MTRLVCGIAAGTALVSLRAPQQSPLSRTVLTTMFLYSVFLLASCIPLALSHGMVYDIWANGHRYDGWNANGDPKAYPSDTPAWYTANAGGGPLHPSDANQTQIICAKGGSNANISAPVAAGADVRLRWWMVDQVWPVGHHGPILSYLASCNGPCASVDMTTLKFVKLEERGWINSSTYQEGYWASDELIANNGSWYVFVSRACVLSTDHIAHRTVRIPPQLAPGEYVLRHEIIALHVAFTSTGPYSLDGAEFYPQCVSLQVVGSGTKTISSGVDARTLYKGDEPGLALNIHTSPDHTDYAMPGPSVWTDAD
jgi:cellulase